ncbi:MAG: sugar nucleotide-binding protein [Acidimicrobiales bacterium]
MGAGHRRDHRLVRGEPGVVGAPARPGARGRGLGLEGLRPVASSPRSPDHRCRWPGRPRGDRRVRCRGVGGPPARPRRARRDRPLRRARRRVGGAPRRRAQPCRPGTTGRRRGRPEYAGQRHGRAVPAEVAHGEASAPGSPTSPPTTCSTAPLASAYTEWDPVCPASAYGRSKAAGEAELGPDDLCVRTSWVAGARGGNLVKTVLRLAAADPDRQLAFVDDQRGCPTFAADLARTLLLLVSERHTGTFHVTNARAVSWYEFVREILEASGHSPDRVRPIATAERR